MDPLQEKGPPRRRLLKHMQLVYQISRMQRQRLKEGWEGSTKSELFFLSETRSKTRTMARIQPMFNILFAGFQIGIGMLVFLAESSSIPGLSNSAYSKFRSSSKGPFVNSRLGMLFLYMCPLAVGTGFLYRFFGPVKGVYLLARNILPILWSIHFSRRISEVLFVHSYSGPMALFTALSISIKYSLDVTATCFFANKRFPISKTELAIGLALFTIGELGNAYHHCLLAGLRKRSKDKSNDYVVPQGGLFSLLVAPHYFFELLAIAGILVVSQFEASTLGVFGFMALYLSGRSSATQTWYLRNVRGWKKVHKDRYKMIPGIW